MGYPGSNGGRGAGAGCMSCGHSGYTKSAAAGRAGGTWMAAALTLFGLGVCGGCGTVRRIFESSEEAGTFHLWRTCI